MGSVFSPYYRAAGRTDPLDHSAMNLCLYGPAPRWTMTERGRADVMRDTGGIAIGPSTFAYQGDGLEARIAERSTPLGRPAEGTIRIFPETVNTETFALDAAGRHLWRTPAPAARVEVRLTAPRVTWNGHAYLDMNWGEEPLETGFRSWHWSRSRLAQSSVVFFDGTCRAGDPFGLALRFDRAGRPEAIDPPPRQHLRRTNWLLPRLTRAEAGHPARLVRTLEDTPFYTRNHLAARLFGEVAPTVHESLDLDRFAAPWVQRLLPYRMPRRPLTAAAS